MRAGVLVVVAALAVACLAGSASGDRRTAGHRADTQISAAELALMPLSLSDLGPSAAKLPLSHDSGVHTNTAAAQDTNTATTAATFSRLGRLTGYELDYSDPALAALASGHGLTEISTEVSVFRDASAASAGLAFERKDDLTVAPLRSPLLSLTASTFSVAKVGDASFGLDVVARPIGIGALYDTGVAFRLGSMVATVAITGAAPDGLDPLALSLGRKLAARMKGVLTGKVGGTPVALLPKLKAGPPAHGPDLSKLTIGPSDLAGAKTTHQGYSVDNDLHPLSEFDRELSPAGSFAFIEATTALFGSASQARITSALLIDTLASKQALDQTLGPDFGGVRVKSIDSKVLRATGAPTALLVTLHLVSGEDVSISFEAVHVGKIMELLAVFGAPGKTLGQGALANLATTAGNRLDGHSTGPVA
jgi:hypothetical protein